MASSEASEEQEIDIPDPRTNVAKEIDDRDFLRRLWSEILQLPALQRAALLLNLRDGSQEGDALPLLLLAGIAEKHEIATTLGLSSGEFNTLADHLPLSDQEIAARLGATPREVINLRLSARRRLQRRMQR